MKTILYFVLFGFAASYVINKPLEWDSTSKNDLFAETMASCNSGNDSFTCTKLNLMRSLDTILNGNNFEFSQYFEVRSNGFENANEASASPVELLDNFFRSHDLIIKFPGAKTNVVISGRNIDNDEVGVKFKFSSNLGLTTAEGRRNKIKRMIIPIMVLILLKAMTIIPMALGVLALKAFNSLQLGFISFLVSISLAIFQICKKLAVDNYAPHVVPHPHWESRETVRHNEDSHNLVYNAYS